VSGRLARGVLAAAALACALAPTAGAEGRFYLVERSDFSRYLDGKYQGHAYRESRCSLAPSDDGYAGSFLVFEETLRDMRSSARRVDREAPVRLVPAKADAGGFQVVEDSGYPSLRGLPSFPAGLELGPGAVWTASGTRALDFDDSGAFVLMPFLAEYRYSGLAEYQGAKAVKLTAKFATRWKKDAFASASPRSAAAAGAKAVSDIVSSASGTHELDILVDASSLEPLFIRDRFDESFALAKGGTERRSGFSLFFYEGGAPLDRREAGKAIAAAVAPADAVPPAAADSAPAGAGPGPLIAGKGKELEDELGPGTEAGAAMDKAGLELDSSPDGLVLRVKDLRFVADSDELLPSEKPRLDAVADALKALPGRSFLVAGHSAAVGKAAGELELSIRRAKRVSDELAARGIEASRLLYRGFGSSRPLAPNDSEAGRAKNRRVEITILD
jgi:outer membrane protein OmpA-like peptidoglycan-associated protein